MLCLLRAQAVAFALIYALTPIGAQVDLPYRTLTSVDARSRVLFSSVATVRPLKNGNVLVHDLNGGRIVLLDSALDSLAVVGSGTLGTNDAYSSPFGALIAWLADSSVFVDPESASMFLFDEHGRPGRIATLPPRLPSKCLARGASGHAVLDIQHRILCRMPPAAQFGQRQGKLALPVPIVADSAPLVRYEPTTRRIDTITYLRVPSTPMTIVQDETCAWVIVPMINPLPIADDWTMLADGAIAIVRAADRRVEWINTDGSRSQSNTIPFALRRLSSDEKVAFVDSARQALRNARLTFTGGSRTDPQDHAVCDPSTVTSIHIFKPEALSDPSSFANYQGRTPPPLLFVAPNTLPDIVPAFGPASTLGDMENRLWIRTSEQSRNGIIYFVLSREGELLARVLVPTSRTIVGFAADHVVYLSVSENGAVRLERARYN